MPDNIIRVLLKGDSKQLQDALKKAESSLNKLSPKLKSVGSSMTKFVTLPLAGAGAAAIKFASSMEESMNKVEVSFGKSSEEVKAFAQNSLESFGIAESTALDMAATFGDMSTAMGVSRSDAASLSTSLVGLAGDLASFKDINIEEVTTALSGVFTGETESLKRLGVVMTEANLKQFALSQGITKNLKDFSQAEKVLLRYQFVMNATSNAHGDFARTGDSAANQTRQFTQGLKELGADLGNIILPFFTKLVTKANEVIRQFKGLDDSTKRIIVFTAGLASLVGPALYVAGTILPKLTVGFNMLNTALSPIPGPLKLIAAAITVLTVTLQNLQEAATGIRTGFFETIKNVILSVGDFNKFTILSAQSASKVVQEEEQAKQDALAKTNTLLQEQANQLEKIMSGAYATPEQAATTIEPPSEQELELLDIENAVEDAMIAKQAIDNIMGQDLDLNYQVKLDEANMEAVGLKVTEVASKFKKASDTVKDSGLKMSINVASMAESIGSALTAAALNGGNAMAALAQVIFSALGDILVQMGTAAVAASKLAETFAIPGVGAAAGIAAIALGTLIKGLSSKIQNDGFAKFANGGIVSTPTLGLVGEYAGARQNPEVIAPLDKLKSLIGDTRSNNVNVTGEFRLDGQDLVVALERANNERNRIL